MEISDHESNMQVIKDVSSNFTSTFCGDMFSFALGLMLLRATGMSLSFGLSMIIMPIVTLIGVVPIGNLVDTYPHKRLLIISLVVRIGALLIYSIAIGHFNGSGKLIPTIGFLIINYASVNLSNSGYMASVHELVNEGHIQKLNSLSQSAASFASTFSPIVAAGLYVIVGFRLFIVFQLTAHVIALVILLTMNFHYLSYPRKSSQTPQESQWAKFKLGLNYLMAHDFLRYLICIALFLNFIFAVINVGLPFMIVEHLHLGNVTLGILNSADALGMLIGNLIISVSKELRHLAKILAVTMVIIGTGLAGVGALLMAAPEQLVVQLVGSLMLFAVGMSLAFMNTPFGIYMQKTVPTELMGRVSSTEMSLNMMSIPLETVFYSFVFQQIPSGIVFIISGMALIAVTGLTMPAFMHVQMPRTDHATQKADRQRL